MSARPDFAALAARLDGPSLIPQWLPNGKREGREWVARNPTRSDGSPGSFKVNLDTGRWADFATGDKGGDLVGLFAHLFTRGDNGAAFRELSSEFGTGDGSNPARATAPKTSTLAPIPSDAPPPPKHPHGEPSAVWTYCDASGRAVCRVARFDVGGGKEFAPLTFAAGRWQWKAPPEPRPLYGLDRLAAHPEAPVIVCEGEKAADAAERIIPGVVAVTAMNGAQSPRKADWSPLAGRRVIVWPDFDKAGEDYARAVAELATAAGAKVAGVIRVRSLADREDLPPTWDAADALAEGLGPFQPDRLPLMPAPIAANDNAAPPLFDLAAASIADMLTTTPPRREYLVEEFLPYGITGAVVAPGGTGKSFLLMQLAVAVAASDGFLGYRTPAPAGVLMMAAEDDRDEIHRRLAAVLDLGNLNRTNAFEMGRLDLIARNLHIVARVGDENRLTLRGPDGTISASPLVQQVIAAARQVPELRLIILDPVSRFRDGDENASSDATRFVEACERIRKETGATVLLAHHARKGATGAQDDIRGSSAFVDALRWAATLHKLTPEDAKEFDLDKGEASRLLRLALVKANYVAPQEPVYLTRGLGGRLEPIEQPEPASKNRKEARSEERYASVLATLLPMIREHDHSGKPLSRTAVRAKAGAEGIFRVSDKTLRAILERAIEEGRIRVREAPRNGETLHVW